MHPLADDLGPARAMPRAETLAATRRMHLRSEAIEEPQLRRLPGSKLLLTLSAPRVGPLKDGLATRLPEMRAAVAGRVRR